MYFNLIEQTEDEYSSNLPQWMKANSLVPTRHRMQQSWNHRVLIKVSAHVGENSVCTHTSGLEYSHQSNQWFYTSRKMCFVQPIQTDITASTHLLWININHFMWSYFVVNWKCTAYEFCQRYFQKSHAQSKREAYKNSREFCILFGLVIWPKNSMDGTLSTICGFREHIRKVKRKLGKKNPPNVAFVWAN